MISAAKKTKITILDADSGEVIKRIGGAMINYSTFKDVKSLVQLIAMSTRLSPQDPIYAIEKIVLHRHFGGNHSSSASMIQEKENKSDDDNVKAVGDVVIIYASSGSSGSSEDSSVAGGVGRSKTGSQLKSSRVTINNSSATTTSIASAEGKPDILASIKTLVSSATADPSFRNNKEFNLSISVRLPSNDAIVATAATTTATSSTGNKSASSSPAPGAYSKSGVARAPLVTKKKVDKKPNTPSITITSDEANERFPAALFSTTIIEDQATCLDNEEEESNVFEASYAAPYENSHHSESSPFSVSNAIIPVATTTTIEEEEMNKEVVAQSINEVICSQDDHHDSFLHLDEACEELKEVCNISSTSDGDETATVQPNFTSNSDNNDGLKESNADLLDTSILNIDDICGSTTAEVDQWRCSRIGDASSAKRDSMASNPDETWHTVCSPVSSNSTNTSRSSSRSSSASKILERSPNQEVKNSIASSSESVLLLSPAHFVSNSIISSPIKSPIKRESAIKSIKPPYESTIIDDSSHQNKDCNFSSSDEELMLSYDPLESGVITENDAAIDSLVHSREEIYLADVAPEMDKTGVDSIIEYIAIDDEKKKEEAADFVAGLTGNIVDDAIVTSIPASSTITSEIPLIETAADNIQIELPPGSETVHTLSESSNTLVIESDLTTAVASALVSSLKRESFGSMASLDYSYCDSMLSGSKRDSIDSVSSLVSDLSERSDKSRRNSYDGVETVASASDDVSSSAADNIAAPISSAASSSSSSSSVSSATTKTNNASKSRILKETMSSKSYKSHYANTERKSSMLMKGKKALQLISPVPDAPLYSSGKTGGEQGNSFVTDIRGLDIVKNAPGTFGKTLSSPRAAFNSNSNSNNSNSNSNNSNADIGGGSSSKASKGKMTARFAPEEKLFGEDISSILDMDSSSCSSSSKRGGVGGSSKNAAFDGRPSIGTLTREWEFMKSHFINNADDELKWLMVSKNTGSTVYARNKIQENEDVYYRALFEVQSCEMKYKIANSPQFNLISLIKDMASLHKSFTANPKDLTASAKFVSLRDQLKSMLSKEDVLNMKGYTAYSPYSDKTASLLKFLIDDANIDYDKLKMVRKARDLYSIIPSELSSLQSILFQAKRDSDEALDNMETWDRREKESNDYWQVLRAEEKEWMEREFDENSNALSVMRSLIPVNIASISVNELIDMVKKQSSDATHEGGAGQLFYYSNELASELKSNKLLHWIVTHKDDIATSNFLAGEKKQVFENIEVLDITEIRALLLCLPEKFELDKDGKKLEWKQKLFSLAKTMVSQQRGELVKGSWDDQIKARLLVKLPQLKQEQLRRSVYFHRSKAQCDAKLKQYDDKEALLKRKKSWLAKAILEAQEAKNEYDLILNEMRDVDLREELNMTSDQVTQAKEAAKAEWTESERKKKSLKEEVDCLQANMVAKGGVSKEEFLASLEELKRYLAARGELDAWLTCSSDSDTKGKAVGTKSTNSTSAGRGNVSIPIKGPFDDCPEIVRISRETLARFASAEDEAKIRKLEIAALAGGGSGGGVSSTSSISSSSNSSISSIGSSIGGVNDGSSVNDSSVSYNGNNKVLLNNNSKGKGKADNQIEIINNMGPLIKTKVSTSTTAASTTSTTSSSILQSVNPDLLKCLNKMFSPNPSMSAVSKRQSCGVATATATATVTATTASPPCTAVEDTAIHSETSSSVKKTPRSKLLQKYVNKDAQVVSNSNDNSYSDSSSCSIDEKSSSPMKSFLDQIKSGSGGGESGSTNAPVLVPKLSFLDMIKARKID